MAGPRFDRHHDRRSDRRVPESPPSSVPPADPAAPRAVESDAAKGAAARRAVEAVWRIESGRLIAGLARVTGDVGLAEELAQDALVAALEQWPRTGTPPNPAGWLMTTAKNRGIDMYRRRAVHQQKLAALGALDMAAEGQDPIAARVDDGALDDHIGDDLLRLIFTAAHPALTMDSRVALTLRCLAGLSTEEIARAFLVPESTAAQRIVRAKRTLAGHAVGFDLPGPEEMADRLASVLQVVFLIFNEGYSATAGEDWMRPGADRGGAPARPAAGRAGARRTRGARAAGADGDPGVAVGGPDRARTASRCCCPTRIADAGIGC